jgi:GcrA cell cycle regulator
MPWDSPQVLRTKVASGQIKDWTNEQIEQLRVLWDEGHSISEIGRRMGVSKNSIVGKAHRLALPSRPDCIKRDGVRSPHKILRAGKVTLPNPPMRSAASPDKPAEAQVATDGMPWPVAADQHAVANTQGQGGVAVAGDASRFLPPAIPSPPASGKCRWPMWGNHERTTYIYCGDKAFPGRAYCACHCRIAYISFSERRVA